MPTPTPMRYEMEPATYTPEQVDNAQTIWAYMDEARATIYGKKGSRAEKARYVKWNGIVDGMGSAELRTVAARLGVYAEDVWRAYQSEVESDPDGRDFHKSGASWHYEGIPFLIEKAMDFTVRGLFPALLPVEEAVALMEVEFLPAL